MNTTLLEYPSEISYKLVIKTDKYAGNFERELCAYLTGRIGECEVGEEIRDEYWKEGKNPSDVTEFFKNFVEERPDDDHGCHRPVEIDNLPNESGYFSFSIFFNQKPPRFILDWLKERGKVLPKLDKWIETPTILEWHLFEEIKLVKEVNVE